MEEIIHWELLEKNKVITAKVYIDKFLSMSSR